MIPCGKEANLAWSGRRILFAFTELVVERRLYASPPFFPNTQRLPTLYRTFIVIIIIIIIIGPYQWSTTEQIKPRSFLLFLNCLFYLRYLYSPTKRFGLDRDSPGEGESGEEPKEDEKNTLCVYILRCCLLKTNHRFFLSMFFPPN